MAVERARGSTSHVDVLDRVLDKGIVIDACVRVSLVGIAIELVTVDARVVVASIATYLEHSDALAALPQTGAEASRIACRDIKDRVACAIAISSRLMMHRQGLVGLGGGAL